MITLKDYIYEALIGTKVTKNEIEFVDLGLKSGTLWAKCNLGASEESEYGDYFKFGTTKGGSNLKTLRDIPSKEEATNLTDSEDAAYIQTSGECQIPTKQDFVELVNHCKRETATINGVTGMKFFVTGNPDNYIFFPFAGVCVLDNGKLVKVAQKSEGYYLTREVTSSGSQKMLNVNKRALANTNTNASGSIESKYCRSIKPIKRK